MDTQYTNELTPVILAGMDISLLRLRRNNWRR